MGEGPVHTMHFVGPTVNDDLRGTARTVLTAQIDAFLDLYDIFMRIQVPHVLVGEQQHGAVAVGQPVDADRRMKVEADGKAVECILRQRIAGGREKNVFPVESLPSSLNEMKRSWMMPKRSA